MIGIFDSGVGGLTVFSAFRACMPEADIVYFGDIKNAPYGLRSREELTRLTGIAIDRLVSAGATDIISACNSVSASLVTSFLQEHKFPSDHLIEMVNPTVQHFKDTDRKIAVCATPATIASSIYQDAFETIHTQVRTIAIAELAGAIEFGASLSEIEHCITTAFVDIPRDFDTLLLSCTHYPFVQNIFERLLGQSVHICNPADFVAERACDSFKLNRGSGKIRFIISKDSAVFRKRVSEIVSTAPYVIEVVE